MGCDIHTYIEYSDRGSWRGFGGRINPDRNYSIFNLMAGVRGEGKPLYELRGMPSDAAFSSRDDNQLYASGKFTPNPDWHSHSWLTTVEFEEILKAYDAMKFQFGAGQEYGAILAVLKYFEAQGLPARLVFWFDN